MVLLLLPRGEFPQRRAAVQDAGKVDPELAE
jgi:hypothetical protein